VKSSSVIRACGVIILETANQSQGWDAKPRAESVHVRMTLAVAWLPKGCWQLSFLDVQASGDGRGMEDPSQHEVDFAVSAVVTGFSDGVAQAP
jgi:hypothetical protein